MALLTEPTSSTPKTANKNSGRARSSGSSSPASSEALALIESLTARIEALENQEKLDPEDRAELNDLKGKRLTAKAASESQPTLEPPASSTSKVTRSFGTFCVEDDE